MEVIQQPTKSLRISLNLILNQSCKRLRVSVAIHPSQ